MRIAVIEDDPILLRELTERLQKEGYVVDPAKDGEEGLHVISDYPLDLAIVDVGLPQLSGLEVIRRCRKIAKDLPILILTARSQWQEKVEGLESGADDYLTKPFEMEELLARIRVLLRRSGRWASSVLQCDPVVLDPAAQKVTVKGKAVKLTAAEYRLLLYLMTRAGEVIAKTTLQEHIYDESREVESNVLEVFIRRLRLKLDPKGTLNPIETLRNQGYRFNLKRQS